MQKRKGGRPGGIENMLWNCIKCGKTWGDEIDDDGFMSSGLCRDCCRELLIPTYRKRQRDQGFPDCFGKAGNYCDRTDCCYRKICLKEES